MVSRRSFLVGAGAVSLGSATAVASSATTRERTVRIEPVSGPVSYLLSVDGTVRASRTLCEASDRRVGSTALGKLGRNDADEYRLSGEITRLWSTSDVRVSVDGEVWTGSTDGSAPVGNTASPASGADV